MSAKSTGSGEKHKTFYICNWNSFDAEKFEWVTGNRWESDAVKELLLSLDDPRWDEVTDNEKNADLVVVIPRDRDRRLSIDDLRVYSTGLGGNLKQVLYVHSAGTVAFTEGRVNDWLFFASRASCPVDQIGTWLKEEVKEAKSEPLPLRLDMLLDVVDEYHIGSMLLSRSGQQLIIEASPNRESSTAKFFFGLCRLAKDYNQVEHDINARSVHGQATSCEDIVRDQARLRFLDVCVDLRNAISAYCRCATLAPDARKRILLIDDNPSRAGFDTHLQERVTQFLPKFTLSIWNPDGKLATNGCPLRRGDLEHYTSMSTGESEAFLERGMVMRNNGVEKEEKLEDVLRDTQVIFVDILFTDARGNDHEAGYGIMCGLQRLCRDVQKCISTSENPWPVPEVVAISRASDIAKVQTVYRHGAAGYVLKSRPLSLPGAVADTFHPALDPVDTPHRNFRLLYNLPHKTMGLLRKIVVPRIPFHRPLPAGVSGDQNGDDNGGAHTSADNAPEWRITKAWSDCRKEHISSALPMAKLLAALPKADLHVHPGTCMTPEFLVVASLVMLARHDLDPERGTDKDRDKFSEAIKWLAKAFSGSKIWLGHELAVRDPHKKDQRTILFSGAPDKVSGVAKAVREFLLCEIESGDLNRRKMQNPVLEARYLKFRSILHEALALPDHEPMDQTLRSIEKLSDFTLFFFALQHCDRGGAETIADTNDLMRLYLLWLAGDTNAYGNVTVTIGSAVDINLATWFRRGRVGTGTRKSRWGKLHSLLYERDGWNVEDFRMRNWGGVDEDMQRSSDIPAVKICLETAHNWQELSTDFPSAEQHPIAYLLASGTRSSNLREYLEGCEYTGAEHLQHPFLMHLFAQQTVYEFIRHGVLYAELRASLSGYENAKLEISFSDACACFCTAMGQAQEMARQRYRESQEVNGWLWQNCFDLDRLFNPLKDELATYRFPCKTSVVLTGKRHKSSRLLIREAGAGAVLHARPLNPATSAQEFAEKAVRECRVVGFDLAGQEDEHHPREFRAEYEQISRMHIPVTIHAGENAPVEFVESAILDLRARRLGHGLALADSDLLMDRARDDGICVELCPVSNFQTNAVYPKGKSGAGREYPLREFLEKGLNVTLNTDNPVVSHTNMVKECFQASYAIGKKGLSLWDLLRILRTGFAQSFLTQPERHALLELADQIVFDLFSRPEIIDMLQVATSQRPSSQAPGPQP